MLLTVMLACFDRCLLVVGQLQPAQHCQYPNEPKPPTKNVLGMLLHGYAPYLCLLHCIKTARKPLPGQRAIFSAPRYEALIGKDYATDKNMCMPLPTARSTYMSPA